MNQTKKKAKAKSKTLKMKLTQNGGSDSFEVSKAEMKWKTPKKTKILSQHVKDYHPELQSQPENLTKEQLLQILNLFLKNKQQQRGGSEKDYDKPNYKGAEWKTGEKKTSELKQSTLKKLTKAQIIQLLIKQLLSNKKNERK